MLFRSEREVIVERTVTEIVTIEPDGDVVVQEATEQETVVEKSRPAPRGKPARGKRASVPSWDEILFGGPDDDLA